MTEKDFTLKVLENLEEPKEIAPTETSLEMLCVMVYVLDKYLGAGVYEKIKETKEYERIISVIRSL